MTENTLQGFKDLQPGTTLSNGKYTLQKKIGEGGFGITYQAVHNGLNRTICIKEYFPAGKCVRSTYTKSLHLQGFTEAQFEKYRQAFVKEAKTLSNLQHPNIVEVIDVFDENNTSYMVMSFIQGKSLYNIVKERGVLPYQETVNYIAQITDAVGYIHQKNILHRDIKPDNIIITPDFKAILIDFGSAREFIHDQSQVHTSLVSHGYAPTEQYTANGRKGAYTDIYAIGATFYFALTGKAPLEAAARLTEIMHEPKELSPGIPDEANRTILKAMQLKAENRHQSIQEFMDDLRNAKPSTLVNETIGTAPVVKKIPALLVIGIVMASLLLLAGVGYLVVSMAKRPAAITEIIRDVGMIIDTEEEEEASSSTTSVTTTTPSPTPASVPISTPATATASPPVPTATTTTTPTSSLQAAKNVITYPFGKYSGSLKNGIPEGEGTMSYTRYIRIAKHAGKPYYANDGDLFVGSWGNGDIVSGKLYDRDNNLKSTILAGRRPNPYDLNKD